MGNERMNYVFYLLLVVNIFENGNSQIERRLVGIEMESDFIYGDSFTYQYYFANLSFGTPPEVRTLIIDTGSAFVGFPCSQCTHCGKNHFNSLFDINHSQTGKILKCDQMEHCNCVNGKCTYRQSYTEGSSYEGFYVSDKVFFGDNSSEFGIDFIFGCHTKETNLFYDQKADGIIGLSKGGEMKGLKLLPELMKEKGIIDHNEFSLCFGINGGRLFFGGYNHSLNIGNHDEMPIGMNVDNFYHVQILDIQIAGITYGRSRAYPIAFIDSGTTYTFFPKDIYSQILKLFTEACICRMNDDEGGECLRCGGNQHDITHRCYIYDEKKLLTLKEFYKTFPTFDLEFEQSKRLQWFPSEYLVFEGNDLGYCIGIDTIEGDIILGGTFIRQMQVVFDLESSKFSFARAECSTDQNQIKRITELRYLTVDLDSPPSRNTTKNKQKDNTNDKNSKKTSPLHLILVIGGILAALIVIILIIYAIYKICKRKSNVDEKTPMSKKSDSHKIQLSNIQPQIMSNDTTQNAEVFVIDDELPEMSSQGSHRSQSLDVALHSIPSSKKNIIPSNYGQISDKSINIDDQHPNNLP